MSESSTAESTVAEESSTNEVAVNYTISSPLRKTLRPSVEKEDNEVDEKISATFTLSPPPKSNSISLLANRLEKGIDTQPDVGANSVTATINVPLINKNTIGFDISDRLKKTEQPSQPAHQKIPPIPQPRSLFDIDNATSAKLADKLQQEAKRCDATAISDSPISEFPETLPPSPIHHTIFGERRPSWRLKYDNSSKVNADDHYTMLLLDKLAQTNKILSYGFVGSSVYGYVSSNLH